MAWETRNGRGRYYTRSHKVAGRVVREYIGCGILGDFTAAGDARVRADRLAQRAAWQRERARLAALDEPLARLDTLTDAVTAAVLTLAGYHRHDCGTWRKRRAC